MLTSPLDTFRFASIRWLAHRSFDAKWRLANGLGALQIAADTALRELTLSNLWLCFPELTVDQRVTLAREYMREAVFAQIDQFRLWTLSAAELREQVTLLNAGTLHEHLRARPVVVVCPHFLGMEAASQRLSLEASFVSIYRARANNLFEARRAQARSRFNAQQLFKVGAPLTQLVRRMKSGAPLFLLPDVDSPMAASVFSPYFGVSASTSCLAAWCGSKLGAVVLPMSVERSDREHYVATIHDALPEFSSDLKEGTHLVNQAIEKLVRAAPTQYCWAQPRFTTRPDGDPDLYSARVMKFLRDRDALSSALHLQQARAN
jgi:Kdo2-lipid IVA lauroyltransferase/acyltransferase